MTTLYVGGIPKQAGVEFLRGLFGHYGELRAVRLVRRDDGESHRGFGYVTFGTATAACTAKRSLDGTVIDASRLRVALAK